MPQQAKFPVTKPDDLNHSADHIVQQMQKASEKSEFQQEGNWVGAQTSRAIKELSENHDTFPLIKVI